MLSAVDDEMMPMPSLSGMVIKSTNTLTGAEIDQRIPETWNDKPPLLTQHDRKGNILPESDRLLKGMIRMGIPPALRAAVQLSNIIQSVHPHQDSNYWHEYRTLNKVRPLDSAYESLIIKILSSHGHDNDNITQPLSDKYKHVWKSIEACTYGRSTGSTGTTTKTTSDIKQLIPGITESGELAMKRVLIAIEQIIGVSDYAPLIPILVALLLCNMSESYTFAALREMGYNTGASWYFPITRTEHAAWCYAFGDIMRKLHKQTAEYLEDRGVLDVDGLAPIFQDFFLSIIPFQYVQRILDIYTLEGSKVIFRFGIALLVLYKKESAEQLITISNSNEWWNTLKIWAYSKRFNFDFLVRKAYGVHGRGIRKQMRFPRRSILQRIVKMEEERIKHDETVNNQYRDPPARPLGLVHRPAPIETDKEEEKAILAQSTDFRQHIAQWLPITLRLTNLDLIYSTNYHGRTLERFYEHVKNSKHTILLCEVLQRGTKSNNNMNNEGQSSLPYIIGMYGSHVWRPSTQVYGDGSCFLFRLQPDAMCWHWHPSSSHNDFDFENNNDEDSSNKTALLEQFMVGTRNMISMGGNPDGSSGLRINEDLTIGESSTAVGFDNEPLHGKGKGSVFDIGIVEVYGLVRQIDERPV